MLRVIEGDKTRLAELRELLRRVERLATKARREDGTVSARWLRRLSELRGELGQRDMFDDGAGTTA